MLLIYEICCGNHKQLRWKDGSGYKGKTNPGGTAIFQPYNKRVGNSD
jgi:hypothetical protein